MDVSYIVSVDELFTLMSTISDHSDAGHSFCETMLTGAKICELDGLVDKKIARRLPSGQLELIPVFNMLIDAFAKADSFEERENGCLVRSPWITMHCENYPFIDNHIKITPLKEG